jgi:hypothetical protein
MADWQAALDALDDGGGFKPVCRILAFGALRLPPTQELFTGR